MHILSLITFLSNNILCTSLTNYRYKFTKHKFWLNSVSGSEDIDMSNRVYILFGYIWYSITWSSFLPLFQLFVLD